MTLARSNSFASAGRGTNGWGTPYRISPLFIPTRNSELQTGIFVVPARLSLLDQHDQAAKPASLPHIVRAVHARIERKGKNDGIRTQAERCPRSGDRGKPPCPRRRCNPT